jgi:hypothetical protein
MAVMTMIMKIESNEWKVVIVKVRLLVNNEMIYEMQD